jgi:hypothetical protein
LVSMNTGKVTSKQEWCEHDRSPAATKNKAPRTTEKVELPRAVSERPSGGAYARFLELPPALVLGVLWLVGAVLLALCGLALYLVGTALP